jgi:CAAX protease family protein
MNVKQFFFNQKEQQIRAGWRMSLFIAILAIVTAASRPLITWFVMLHTGIPDVFTAEVCFYGLATLATYLALRFVDGRPFRSVGLIRHGAVVAEITKGLLIGGGMMTVIFIVEYSAGWAKLSFKPLSSMEVLELTSIGAVIFIIGAYGEELLFRGYVFQTMTEGTGKIIAVIFFAVLFGLMHASNPHVTFFSIVNVCLAGIWLSIAYYKTKALWFPIALHFSWNFLQNNIYSFPVSGLQFQQYQLGVLIQSGPSWVTGGAFGPEGGILTTVLVIGSTIWFYYAPWLRPSERVWTIEQWRMGRTNLETVQSE